MRHPLGLAVGIGVRYFHNAPRYQPQSGVQTELLGFVKQHLHPKADTQQRRARGGLLAYRLHKAQLFQTVHTVPKRPDAGQYQRFRGQNIRGLVRNQRLCPKMRKGVLHAEQIGQAVVNNCHLHTRRTSTPPARMSSFSSCTVSFL